MVKMCFTNLYLGAPRVPGVGLFSTPKTGNLRRFVWGAWLWSRDFRTGKFKLWDDFCDTISTSGSEILAVKNRSIFDLWTPTALLVEEFRISAPMSIVMIESEVLTFFLGGHPAM